MQGDIIHRFSSFSCEFCGEWWRGEEIDRVMLETEELSNGLGIGLVEDGSGGGYLVSVDRCISWLCRYFG